MLPHLHSMNYTFMLCHLILLSRTYEFHVIQYAVLRVPGIYFNQLW